jgi:hypothetical protein
MRVTLLRRAARTVLVVRPDVVLQRRDVEAHDHFLALGRVVLAPPVRDVPLVAAVRAARLTRRRARVGHGVIVRQPSPRGRAPPAGPAGTSAGPDGGLRYRETVAQPRSARIDSRSDEVVASTADGSYPQCAMQLEQRGSLPRP